MMPLSGVRISWLMLARNSPSRAPRPAPAGSPPRTPACTPRRLEIFVHGARFPEGLLAAPVRGLDHPHHPDENDVVFKVSYPRPAAGPLHFHAAFLRKLGQAYGGILEAIDASGINIG